MIVASKSFGEKIKELRQQKGWSQDHLGSLINVHGRHVWKYETGKALPQAETLLKIAEVFDVSTDFLLRDDLSDNAAPNAVLKDQGLIRKFQAVEKMPDDDKKVILSLIDAYIKKQQIETVLSQ